mgnify:CR=1 FL=1
MDMERKYPTREVDGVDVPQMGIKELIKQLGSALETMEGNRKSYTSPEEIEAYGRSFRQFFVLHAFV